MRGVGEPPVAHAAVDPTKSVQLRGWGSEQHQRKREKITQQMFPFPCRKDDLAMWPQGTRRFGNLKKKTKGKDLIQTLETSMQSCAIMEGAASGKEYGIRQEWSLSIVVLGPHVYRHRGRVVS